MIFSVCTFGLCHEGHYVSSKHPGPVAHRTRPLTVSYITSTIVDEVAATWTQLPPDGCCASNSTNLRPPNGAGIVIPGKLILSMTLLPIQSQSTREVKNLSSVQSSDPPYFLCWGPPYIGRILPILCITVSFGRISLLVACLRP
ncbi:hypothetical protein LshimejAT787_0902320 [Lyophyllum shimeji]|uniref:Uncharacterized protein n=1 Tax=Lyophyllum shimeji TaxID=47721 RepID=A0A9P3PQV1_LYOSH|nr:hypothetical protein LshimejAT787_0902320 [Lyophyllum shimeji]